MGYGVMAYSVDLEKIRRIIGSGDEDQARRYGDSYVESDRHGDLARMVEKASPDGGALTLRDIARHMVMGEPYADRVGFGYAYFLKHLCELHGRFLDNSAWYPVPMDFFDEMDRALADAGIDFSTSDLVFGGSPVDLPHIDDFPGIGYLEHKDLAGPEEELATKGPDLAPPYDGPVYDLFQWIAHTHSGGRSLVCFYH